MNKPRKYLTRHYKNVSNFSIAVQSFMIMAAIICILFFGFEYRHETPPEKVQKTVLSRIDLNKNQSFLRRIEIRDPGRVFGVPDGGFAALKGKFDHKKIFSIRPELSGKDEINSGKFSPIAENSFSPSPRSIDPIEKKFIPAIKSSMIITPEGKFFPTALTTEKYTGKNTIINVYRNASIRRYRIIASCGEKKADNAAAAAIMKLYPENGTYSVIWTKEEAKKR